MIEARCIAHTREAVAPQGKATLTSKQRITNDRETSVTMRGTFESAREICRSARETSEWVSGTGSAHRGASELARGTCSSPRGTDPSPRETRTPLVQTRQAFELHRNSWTQNMHVPAGDGDVGRGDRPHPLSARRTCARERTSGVRDAAARAGAASTEARALINRARDDAARTRDHVDTFGEHKCASRGPIACGAAPHTHTHFYTFAPRIGIAIACLDAYSPALRSTASRHERQATPIDCNDHARLRR